MPAFEINKKITQGYDSWLKVFGGSGELRNTKNGIKYLYRGHKLDNPNTINLVSNTSSIDITQQCIADDAELIKQAGNDKF